MLRTIIRLEKLAALRRRFLREGLLIGSTANYFAPDGGEVSEEHGSDVDGPGDMAQGKHDIDSEERLDDAGPENGPQSLSSITLAAVPGILRPFLIYLILIMTLLRSLYSSERHYPKDLNRLAQYINEPHFPSEFKSFLYSIRHPNRLLPDDFQTRVNFSGKIHVFHSAVTRFYAPSDLCGPCRMYHQRI